MIKKAGNKILMIFLQLSFLAGSVFTQTNQTSPSKPLVFTHVTVIDVKRGVTKFGMTVVIGGNRITAVGKTARVRIPRGSQVIDASGKFFIPGLWDMHVHSGNEDFDKNNGLRLLIANGVTGVRFMDGDPEYNSWRKQAEGGSLIAPRMFIASQMIGFGDLSNITADRAREEVKKAKLEDADFIKVHDFVSREAYFALVDEAKRLKLDVEGHVPTTITATEASNAGQKSIEHSTGMDEAKSDIKKAEALIAILKKNRTWICPTLIMRLSYATLDDPSRADDARLKYIKSSSKKGWLGQTKSAVTMPLSEWAQRKETVRKEKALVAKMARNGIGILAGTDLISPYIFPGFSLHDEISLLVEAGLTPLQALQAATINPAKFFDKSGSLGTIDKGKLADLVLLDANPLVDINNTRRIKAVVVNGIYFDDKALNGMLAEIEETAKRN